MLSAIYKCTCIGIWRSLYPIHQITTELKKKKRPKFPILSKARVLKRPYALDHTETVSNKFADHSMATVMYFSRREKNDL